MGRTPTALDRAHHDARPLKLDPRERELLAEGLRRGEDLRVEMEGAITAYGRWILEKVFRNDSAAALDERSKNKVWTELVRRAGGPTLPVSRRLLYVAVAIAANDRRIGDQAWRGLDGARKELLLPLREAPRLREAAQHVSKFNLTQTKTKAYVTELLESDGRERQVRITSTGLKSRLRKMSESFDARTVRQLTTLKNQLSASDRRELRAEITRIKQMLSKVSRALT